MRLRFLSRFPGAFARALAVSGLLLTLLGPSAGAAPIAWRVQFESARAEARARQRPLWVQFTGPWCIFCRRMDSEVFVRPEVAALALDEFVPVKVRADERPDLVRAFGIVSLPATVVIGTAGELRNRHEGFLDAGRFLGFLSASRPPVAPRAAEPPDEIALAGCDVVNYVAGHGLKPGVPGLSARYDGLVFRFLNAENREVFEKNPERYLPTAHGRCVVSLVDWDAAAPGSPRFGVYYKNRLYLCADAGARRAFAADPERYADADVADSGHCPHCRMQENRLVRGESRYALTHQGRRYLFPDPGHLEAFRTSLDRALR